MATAATPVVQVSTHPRWILAVSIALGALGGAGAFVGYAALDAVTPHKDLAYGAWAVGAVAIVALLAVRALTKSTLVIDDDGIEVLARGGAALRIRWSEPHDFYYMEVDGSATPAAEKASIRTADARRIDVVPIAVPDKPNVHVPRLVEQYSTKAAWPRIQMRLRDGEDIAFGVVRLSNERLEVGPHSFPMDHPVSLQVDKGQLQVGAEGGWVAAGVSVLEVANYSCLLKAIGQATQARPPG